MKTPRTPFEQDCIDNAVEWTAVRGVRSNRTVKRFDTREEAESQSIGDRRTMIYAVTSAGRSAHVCNV